LNYKKNGWDMQQSLSPYFGFRIFGGFFQCAFRNLEGAYLLDFSREAGYFGPRMVPCALAAGQIPRSGFLNFSQRNFECLRIDPFGNQKEEVIRIEPCSSAFNKFFVAATPRCALCGGYEWIIRRIR
jgi:hypothetical protein